MRSLKSFKFPFNTHREILFPETKRTVYFVYFIPFVYLLRLLCDLPGVNLDTKAQLVLRVAVNFTHRGEVFLKSSGSVSCVLLGRRP